MENVKQSSSSQLTKIELSKLLGLCILLTLFGIAIYSKVANFGYVPYDDAAFITENKFVTQGITKESVRWSFLYDSKLGDLTHKGVENLWHPITWLSHMLDVELFGIEGPGGHHIVNLSLFILSAVLVMWVMWLISENLWVAFLIALLWMVHPLKVESVAWISERKDILSGFFFWASLGCAIKSIKNGLHWRKAGYILFLAALLSKPSVIVLPVLILLVEGYLKGQKKWQISFFIEGVKRWWLWFISAGLLALITISMQLTGSHDYFVQQSSLSDRLTTSASGLWFYFIRVVAPINLTYEYPQPSYALWIHMLAWAGFIGIGYLVWNKRAEWKHLFFGLSWFLICWLPVSGIIYVGSSFTADRYLYLGLAGLIYFPIKTLSNSRIFSSFILSIAIVWSFLSFQQVGVWKDGFTLFSHATKAQPTLPSAWSNLGKMHSDNDNLEQSEYCYKKAIQLNSNDYTARYNLAKVLSNKGRKKDAIEAYERALIAYPEYLPALLNLGELKKKNGEIEKARDLFAKGIGKDTRMMVLYCECELNLGNIEQARVVLEQLERVNIQRPIVKQHMIFLKNLLKNHTK